MIGEIFCENTINRMQLRAIGDHRRMRVKIGRLGLLKIDSRIPFGALIDPGAEERYLGSRPFRAFFGHHRVWIESGDEADDERLIRLPCNRGRAGVAAFEE